MGHHRAGSLPSAPPHPALPGGRATGAPPSADASEPGTGPDLSVVAPIAAVVGLTLIRLIGLHVSVTDLYFDEAQYWAWAQEPDWGYFSKPPLIAWLIAGATAVCGDAEACVRAPSPILWGGIALTVLMIGRTLGGPRVGAWACLCALLAPGAAFSARIMSTDVPLLLFWSLALLSIVRLRAGGGRGWAVLLALSLGLGLLSKYAMAYFLGCLAVAVLIDPKTRVLMRRPTVWIALACGLAMLAPNLAWNLAHGMVTLKHTGANIQDGGDAFSIAHGLTEAGEFAAAQFGLAGPVVFALTLIALARPWRRSPEARLMLAFSVPVFAAVTGVAFLNGANANWAAPGLVAAFVLAPLLAGPVDRRWLAAGLAFGLAIQVVLLAADARANRIVIADRAPYEPVLGRKAAAEAIARIAKAQGARIVVAERRAEVANLIYDTRRAGLAIRAWPAVTAGVVEDHFQMTRPLTGREAEPVLAVSECADPARYRLVFRRATRVAVVTVPLGGVDRCRLHVFRLEAPTGAVVRPAPCGDDGA